MKKSLNKILKKFFFRRISGLILEILEHFLNEFLKQATVIIHEGSPEENHEEALKIGVFQTQKEFIKKSLECLRSNFQKNILRFFFEEFIQKCQRKVPGEILEKVSGRIYVGIPGEPSQLAIFSDYSARNHFLYSNYNPNCRSVVPLNANFILINNNYNS